MTLHLPSESAMALAMVMSDPRYDLILKRHAAEQALEDLIQFLDDLDGDPDLEPSLGYGGYSRFGEECDLEGDGNCDDEDTNDAEATNEDGGNVTDEPHDALDEGDDEPSLCFTGGLTELDGPCGNGAIGWDEKQAIDAEVRSMLAKVDCKPYRAAPQQIVGPDGRIYTMDWS